MKSRIIMVSLASAALAGMLLCDASGRAAAEDQAGLEGIVVTAERVLTVERPSGVMDQEFRVKGRAYFSDLDLATREGRQELEARIARVAADACTELDKLMPARTLEHGNCVRESVERAMAEVERR
jgi:UrcA family protein